VHAKACAGSPARAILQYADELRPDLLVVGSHGRSAFGRLFLGSVSQKVLHAAHGSVRIARGHAAEPSGPIRLIVGMDGSPGAEAAVKAVAGRHWPRGSEARLVNGTPILPRVADEISVAQITAWWATEKARVEEVIKLATGKLKGANLVVSTKVKDLDARQLLISEAEAWEADCIFVGARGMGAVERFVLGSVSSSVAARALLCRSGKRTIGVTTQRPRVISALCVCKGQITGRSSLLTHAAANEKAALQRRIPRRGFAGRVILLAGQFTSSCPVL
jgi:nucleotide-binding universal stress UspA family protein